MNYNIVIDADLEDVIPMFQENRNKDIKDLKTALLDKDKDKLQFIGHSLKGVGSGYGFVEVTNIGQIIEFKAKENELKDIAKLIIQLEDYLDNVKITYVDEDQNINIYVDEDQEVAD